MIKITVQVKTGALDRLAKALDPAAMDLVVDRVSLQVLAEVVQATPQKWFGQVRKSWRVETPKKGTRRVVNDNKIMLFLEEGTKAHGPVTKKFLYIPLNRRAALGWQPGMKFGIDFILKKYVQGIKAMHIAADEAKKANELLNSAMRDYLRKAIKG